ncbi:Dps family protein [Candidatus Hydrogenosomobacter endosymbioticus]|uniref:DNA starvation/stationary phase protection protein n=1 Tax=Candidatus Hydrogenosomobacter endosymbioticus TaxID=2558174 RepID=A0ABN6L2Y2_9PROT|nr:DNA starvation/stationary phase protection protein [Candidatus Hydrogenosomobacter endosymbioticus]BDB96168.1 DNA starvation/stationary phase protection protein [Candidatus Hydrogenosomobacter endosymbioticus]
MNKSVLSSKLKTLLADSYALYIKTQNYHWNVEGSDFVGLHTFFEEKYRDLAEAIDSVAEFIRMLGEKAPGTFAEFASATSIKDGVNSISAMEMVRDLADGQNILQKTLHEVYEEAERCREFAISGFASERISAHKKAEWILRSLLK